MSLAQGSDGTAVEFIGLDSLALAQPKWRDWISLLFFEQNVCSVAIDIDPQDKLFKADIYSYARYFSHLFCGTPDRDILLRYRKNLEPRPMRVRSPM